MPDGALGFAQGLIERVRAYDPRADLPLIFRALDFAAAAHAGQTRDNGDPYITHPVEVATILTDFRVDTSSIVTALLHDVVEDTGTTLADVERGFGRDVARLVDGVTKLNRLELTSERSKQAENFRKLVLAMSEDIRVLLVKLADRLHNMRTLRFVRDENRRRRIAAETLEIYAPLAERIGMDQIKTELETLAFRELQPDAYASIMNRIAFLRGEGADLIERVTEELRKLMTEAGIAAEVTGREKSPYSIWLKMHRRNVAFEQLSDIMAFRVIVGSIDECYRALGIVHSAYRVVPGRFKDYISTPKPNGYRSLHTGVMLPEGQKIEVQIRTREMHEIAEYGVAAHWHYKDKGSIPAPDPHQYRWLRSLLEILEQASGPEEFLEHTKLEMFRDQVFCFTPKGDLITLPRGATPVDFAYAVHSEVGDTCVGAKINGRIMPLRTELANGDQVEIITARGHTPNPEWERFVVTGKARARIRRFVHAQAKARSIEQGRAMLVKAFRQEGVEGGEKVLEGVLKTLKQASLEDLYAAVGSGAIGPREVVFAAYPELRPRPRPTPLLPAMSPRSARPQPSGREEEARRAVPIAGLVSGMAVHYAGCCHPLPGDRIVGIITTGKGVTIHTADCPTLESFAATPERFIDVSWDTDTLAEAKHTGRLAVVTANQPGALSTLTTVIAKREGNISNLKIVGRSPEFFEMLVDLEVRDLSHLGDIIAALRASPHIRSVERARA
ncbi:RelA/SpoT family protein [Elioraea thermophila]|uniref:RelA/SpoT family protein n=1 Tax=Elioraea thermophila TaxID=2185104 RepID=UPI000DF1EEDF|nr:bifunctional (p)ppGpp synthetase/guanosine-3',5'-bis(diphosphate) 3'-pyrophosphohydrolase [Elioraea thermophila]